MAKQLDVLFRHFATGGTITTYEATVKFGICRLSERCRELCARGWDIQGETEKSAEGKYFKRYWLNPEQLAEIKGEKAAGLGGLPGQPPLVGLQTSAAHKENALGTAGSAQGVWLDVDGQPTGCSLRQFDQELKCHVDGR